MSTPTTASTPSRWRKALTWSAPVPDLCVLGWQSRRFDARATVSSGEKTKKGSVACGEIARNANIKGLL